MKKVYKNPELEILAVDTRNMIALSIETESGELSDSGQILSKRRGAGETTPSGFWREEKKEN
jgi:hypothetical protein